MKSDFRLVADDYPDEATPDQVKNVRAKALQMALMHAATDPAIRFKMLMIAAIRRGERWLARELSTREPEEVRALAQRALDHPEIMLSLAGSEEAAAAWDSALRIMLPACDEKRE